MYPLRPTAVYVLEGVLADRLATQRLNRMLDALGIPLGSATIVTQATIPEVAAKLVSGAVDFTVPQEASAYQTRSLVFTMQRVKGQEPDLSALHARCPEGTPLSVVKHLCGEIRTAWFRTREGDLKNNQVCWTAWEFGTQVGCPHGCQYCGDGKLGKYIVMGMNLEEYVEEVVDPILRQNPWQKCFRIIGWNCEQVAFEPEYGLFDLATRKCAELGGDRHMIIHTKCANTDWALELPARKHIVAVWSVCGANSARIVEPGTPGPVERFEAMRRCQDAGMSVRAKFKPIVPIRGWREDYAEAVEALLQRVRPDSIGMTVVMWMDAATLKSRIDPDLLDPEYLQIMEEAQEEMAGVNTGPFPEAVRLQIYRHIIQQVRRFSKDIPLYVSTETPEVWSALRGELGQDPRHFLCGCGPVAMPGGKLALSKDLKYTTLMETDA